MLTTRMNFKNFDDFWLPNLGKQGPIADYPVKGNLPQD
jgi:hypothetical protein